MLFALRVTVPDRPGSLAHVSGALAQLGADIVTLDVLDRGDGHATDEICVEAPDGYAEAIRRAVEGVDGAVVLAARPVGSPPDRCAALELATHLATAEDPVQTLVDGLPAALWASWCLALIGTAAGPRVVAASPSAPARATFETPWLPLDQPCRLEAAPWMPPSWRMSAGAGALELAAAPAGDAWSGVLVARQWGARFLPDELRQLGMLAGVAGARAASTV